MGETRIQLLLVDIGYLMTSVAQVQILQVSRCTVFFCELFGARKITPSEWSSSELVDQFFGLQ